MKGVVSVSPLFPGFAAVVQKRGSPVHVAAITGEMAVLRWYFEPLGNVSERVEASKSRKSPQSIAFQTLEKE
jgi:hypothetical protein